MNILKEYKYSFVTFGIVGFTVFLTWLLLFLLTDIFNNHPSITEINPVFFSQDVESYGAGRSCNLNK